jgi:glycosyltransferase involved in cell wall biosynthesis
MRCPTLAELPPIENDKTGWPWTAETPQLSPARTDGSPWPLVSIITPSYNQGQFIEETIRSVLLQGYPEIEYIIMDGGSTDQSVEIIKKYERWLASWVSEKDGGQSAAINKGLDCATGPILSWLNSDDVLLPGAVASIAQEISDCNECLLVAGKSEYRDETGTKSIWVIERVPQTLHEIFSYFGDTYFAQPSVYFTRSGLYQSGGLNDGLHYAMDLDLWLRMAETSRIYIIGRHLSWMRQHNDAKTWRDTFQTIEEVERVLMAHSRKVPAGTLAQARRLARSRRSEAWVAVGLRLRRTGNQREAWHAAYSAARTHLGTAFSRPWASLVLRLILPAFARRLVFGGPQ